MKHQTSKVSILERISVNSPVIYDNDAHSDVFTDELLLLLAHAGKINLKAFITSSARNFAVERSTWYMDYHGREAILKMAKESGIHVDIPHLKGPCEPLQRPVTDRLEDTVLENRGGEAFLEAAHYLVEEAKNASKEEPLVLLMGGPLTVAAEAWLMDQTITDRLILIWLGADSEGMRDYNAWADPWSAALVMQVFDLLIIPFQMGAPEVDRSQFKTLPPLRFRQWLEEKRLPHVNQLPEGLKTDDDAQPVIAFIDDSREYIQSFKHVSLSHWEPLWGGLDVPMFKEDPLSRTILVTKADQEIANRLWHEAIYDFAAWPKEEDIQALGLSGIELGRRPLFASPFPIDDITRIEAEDFDQGEHLDAYYTLTKAVYETPYRTSPVALELSGDTAGGYARGGGEGYAIAGMKASEWLKYSVKANVGAKFKLSLRVKGFEVGSQIECGTTDQRVLFTIDEETNKDEWLTLDAKNIWINEGVSALSLTFLTDAKDGLVNYIHLEKK